MSAEMLVLDEHAASHPLGDALFPLPKHIEQRPYADQAAVLRQQFDEMISDIPDPEMAEDLWRQFDLVNGLVYELEIDPKKVAIEMNDIKSHDDAFHFGKDEEKEGSDLFFQNLELTPHLCQADCVHSVQVAQGAMIIAMKYIDVDPIKAGLAGLGHDIGKNMIKLKTRLASLAAYPYWGSGETIDNHKHTEYGGDMIKDLKVDPVVEFATRYHHTTDSELVELQAEGIKMTREQLRTCDVVKISDMINARLTRTNNRNADHNPEERFEGCLAEITPILEKYYPKNATEVAIAIYKDLTSFWQANSIEQSDLALV